MRIGIYNRWMQTMGGGERCMGAFAQVLQYDHSVEILTHQAVDLDVFARHLNLDLTNVTLRLVPYEPDHQSVIACSAEYDLFINASHLDMFIPRAHHNVLRVFFPGRTEQELHGQEHRVQRHWLDALVELSHLELTSGFYHPETALGRTFAWTSDRAYAIVLRQTERRATQLQVVLHGWRPQGVEHATVQLVVNDQLLATRQLPSTAGWIDWRVPLPPELAIARKLYVRLASTTFNPAHAGVNNDNRNLGVAIAALRVLSGAWTARLVERSGVGQLTTTVYERMLAHYVRYVVQTYDQVLANSRFTQQWIERRWGIPSDIIFPPVDTSCFAPGVKRPMIISVGRFFGGSHNKKHLPMIAAFRALCDAGLSGWEYHLVGGCDESMPEHQEYLQQVRAAAEGYPIVQHVNAPFPELQQLYALAQIFWHATGYGEDEEHDPDSFEHFGITTVEAMSAGCVPVVIVKAGQREIVMPNESGLLWHTLDQLQSHTQRLTDDPALLQQLAEGARQRSQAFGMDVFSESVHKMLDKIEVGVRS